MVSFQCDGCQDIVKKPKLDQHRSRGCNTSFTCIDCSKTFPTPADWKGHTSCISESQKYEKSLYRPKANGGGREQRRGTTSVGKYQRRGGSWARPPLGRPRFEGTGANGTPLGTPTRMSPVTAPNTTDNIKHASSHAPPANTDSTKDKEGKSHKMRNLDGDSVGVVEAPPTQPEEFKKKDKEKKEKKAKEKHKEGAASKTTKFDISTVDHKNIPLPPSPVPAGTPSGSVEKPKKSKKEKRKKVEEDGKMEATQEESGSGTVIDSTGGEMKKKKKRKSDKTVAEADADIPMADATKPPEEKTKSKRKREAEEKAETADGEVEDAQKRKKKKKKSS